MNSSISLQIAGNLITPDLTPDLLQGEIKGQTPQDFGLAKNNKLADEIAIAWGDAKAYWAAFSRAQSRLPEGDPATTVTREQWAIPLLRSLGYEPVYVAKAEIVEGQTYAISHRAEPGEQRPPLHIIGSGVKLEQRPPSGTPRLSAHALVQEYLNRTEHLWGIVTNGRQWRLLRDSSLMTRLTYVEFDLEQMLNGENFAEFGLFYRLFHRSRLPATLEDGDHCLLEFYHQESLQRGGRVRDRLRDGVERALKVLGTGFLQHPQSGALREALAAGRVTAVDYYRQLLRLIYRLLFLMVAESRHLLLTTADPNQARIYQEYYSIERLRLLVERPSWRREGFQDLWQGLRITFRLFDENWRGEALGLSALNGDLFGSEGLGDLDGAGIDNHDLILALRGLSLYEQKGQLRRVNYGALDVEELGSVYESLLDFYPQVNEWGFELVVGSDRKTTGSYYTPPALVGQLIKSALDPIIERCCVSGQQEAALLGLKVCDPACGSGHFLLAAARRIGKELARIRTGEAQPGPEPMRLAIRDVIQHCIYGVDLNPLAVDLCKVALWIEGFCGGMPLSFLDHRIKCGNSLVGVMDLDVLKGGIPEGAYKPVTGDDKAIASNLKKSNTKQLKAIASGQLSLFDLEFGPRCSVYASRAAAVEAVADSTIAGYREKVRRYGLLREDGQWWQDFSACHLWTAAFFMGLTAENLALMPTTEALDRLLAEARRLADREMEQGSLFAVGETSRSTPFNVVQIVAAAHELGEKYRFFHWPLEFPEVFEQGGFDCVLGNPPWERIKLQEKEFFGSRDREIAGAKNSAARKKLIQGLAVQNPELLKEFNDEKHFADAQGKFIRESGRFPLTARGDINTYAVFAETVRTVVNEVGRAGVIVPTGIATDATTANFFGDLIKTKSLATLYDFENRENIFDGVGHGRFKFSLLTLSGKQEEIVKFSFFLTNPRQVGEAGRVFEMTPNDIRLMNPNTLNCPVFRTHQDAEITKKIYQSIPVLEQEDPKLNPWGISFMRMFDMSNDSNLFQDNFKPNHVPLYEAKMFWHYDHRFGDYADYPEGAQTTSLPNVPIERLQNPDYTITPRYWVEQSEVENRLENWKKEWLLAFRGICRATDDRTAILTILPKAAVGHSSPLILIKNQKTIFISCLLTNLNSLVFDFVTRQKLGGSNFSLFILKQLPVIPPDRYTQADIDYIAPRVLELTYTAHDIKPFADDLWKEATPEQRQQLAQRRHPPHSPELQQIDLHSPENPLPPFLWDENRRAKIRAELDAKYAQLYQLTRDELRYILDPADIHGPDFPSETFRVLKNNEIKKYGEYRTQRLILAAWDIHLKN